MQQEPRLVHPPLYPVSCVPLAACPACGCVADIERANLPGPLPCAQAKLLSVIAEQERLINELCCNLRVARSVSPDFGCGCVCGERESLAPARCSVRRGCLVKVRGRAGCKLQQFCPKLPVSFAFDLSLIHISEPTRPRLI
eukprot:2041280-Rhodomonas_salina.2